MQIENGNQKTFPFDRNNYLSKTLLCKGGIVNSLLILGLKKVKNKKKQRSRLCLGVRCERTYVKQYLLFFGVRLRVSL